MVVEHLADHVSEFQTLVLVPSGASEVFVVQPFLAEFLQMLPFLSLGLEQPSAERDAERAPATAPAGILPACHWLCLGSFRK